MSLRSDVLYSLKWLAGARLVGQLVNWAITLVVIRILNPSDYGLMAIAEVMIGFAILFRELGLYSAIVQKPDLTTRQIEQSFGLLLVINTAIYAGLFFSAPLFSSFFGDPRLTLIIKVLGIQFLLAAVGVVQSALLSRTMEFRKISLVRLSASLGNGFATLALALSGAGVWALVIGSLVGSTIISVGMIVSSWYWCRPRFTWTSMGSMLRFGSFVTISRICWYFYSKSDVFIIGKLLNSEILGFYAIGLQLASLPMKKVGAMLNQVSLAAYSSVQNDMSAVRSHYFKSVRVLAFVSFPVFWGISSVSPEIVSVVLGQRWLQAIVPLQLLSLIMPIRMISQVNNSPLEAINKPHIAALNLFAALIVMPPAFFIGTYYGGLTGASLAWIFAFPILWLAQVQILLFYLRDKPLRYFKSIMGPALGGAVMYLAVMLLRELVAEPMLPPAAGLVFLIMVGVLVYPAFMWCFCRKSCTEMLDLFKSGQRSG